MTTKIEVEIQPKHTIPSTSHRVGVNIHEGSVIVIIGTNGKVAGWIDAHKDIAPHFYRDQFLAPETSHEQDN